MPRLTVPSSLALLGVALVAALVWYMPAGETAPAAAATQLAAVSSDAKPVALQITIEDEDSGLLVQVKRTVPSGTSGIDAMRATVAIETKEFEGLGLFVTSLCGIKPTAGKFWSPSIDGEKSQLGIARIKIEKDTHLRWKTQAAQAP